MQHSNDGFAALVLPADRRSGRESEWKASLVPVAHLPIILHAFRALERAGATQILVGVDDDQAEEMAAAVQPTGARVLFGNSGTFSGRGPSIV